MNLALEIKKKLENRNFDEFTTIRYIYLYICKIFSYDSRFYNTMRPKLREEIYYKEIDINNVNDFEVVCLTLSKVLIDVLSLFGIKGELVEEKTDSLYKHTYVVVNSKGYRLKLDPTKFYDTARVKLHLSTYGFIDLDGNNEIYDDILEADRKIHYCDKKFFSYDNYHNFTIKSIRNVFIKVARKLGLEIDELFDKKLDEICSNINYRHDITRHNDIDYYISYLLGIYGLKQKNSFVRGSIFYDKENPSKIIDIFHVKNRDYRECLNKLEKKEKYYHIEEIGLDKFYELMENYEGINQYYYEEVANGMKKSKGRIK